MNATRTALIPLLIIALSCASADDPGGGTTTPPVVPPVTPPTPPATVLFDEGFEDNAFTARGWYDLPTGVPMATSTTVAKTGSRSLEVRFPPGAVEPAPWYRARRLFTASESVYVRYWVRYTSNWQGSGQTYHPHEFYLVTNEDGPYVGPAVTFLTAYIEHNYQNGGVPSLAIQDSRNIDETKIGVNLTGVTENRAVAGCNGSTDGYPFDCYAAGALHRNGKAWRPAQPSFLPNAGAGYKGDWNLVEAYFQLNTINSSGIGVANGIVQYWFNGQAVLNLTNVLLRTGAHPTMKFNQFMIGPYIGDGSPVDQTMWVDDLRIATARTP